MRIVYFVLLLFITTPLVHSSAIAIRQFPQQVLPDGTISITLLLDVNESNSPTGIIVKEYLPAGWNVTSSSPAGYFNSSLGIIKWVLYNINGVSDSVISYTVRAPPIASGTYTFSGVALTLSDISTTSTDVQLSAVENSKEVAIAGGGGGDGGAPETEPPLTSGVNILTPELMKDLVRYLNLQSKGFYRVPRTLAASLLATSDVTGKYPLMEHSEIISILTYPPKNFSGNVYEIAAQQALDKYKFADTVLIARGDLPVDSIAAIAYAKEKNAPILLTKPDELPEVTLDAIKRLSPTRIVIVGGPVAVSQEIEKQLSGLAQVERIWGRDRYETALKLAESTTSLKASEIVVIADGRKVSVEAAIVASSFNAPVLYVSDALSPGVREYLEYRRNDSYRNRLKLVVSGVGKAPMSEIEEILSV